MCVQDLAFPYASVAASVHKQSNLSDSMLSHTKEQPARQTVTLSTAELNMWTRIVMFFFDRGLFLWLLIFYI